MNRSLSPIRFPNLAILCWERVLAVHFFFTAGVLQIRQPSPVLAVNHTADSVSFLRAPTGLLF